MLIATENHWLKAQNTPEFQYTLYVEDARGKKDSVVLGYDRTETRATINPNFGEVDIKNRPFDSTLEVRATDAADRFAIKFHSKKAIAFYEGVCPQNASSSIITLLIRAKYYPIKFSWNKAAFTDLCRSRSLLLNSESYFALDIPPTRGIDSLYSVTYLKNQSEKVEKFDRRTPSGQPNPIYHYVFLAPTNDGRNDTIWTYSVVFRSEFINKVDENSAKQVKSYPNPTREFLNLEFSDSETGNIQIFDLTGRNVKTLKVESTNQLQIDVHDLTVGMYFLQFKTAAGKTYVSKFIKS